MYTRTLHMPNIDSHCRYSKDSHLNMYFLLLQPILKLIHFKYLKKYFNFFIHLFISRDFSRLILIPMLLDYHAGSQTGSLSTDIGRGCEKWAWWRFVMFQFAQISQKIGSLTKNSSKLGAASYVILTSSTCSGS